MAIQYTQRKKPIPTSIWRVAALLLAALALGGAGSVPYNLHDQAAYVSQAIIDFLRPGLKIRIESAAVASDGTISVTFNLTDPAGLALDVPGVFTPGPITLGYVAAWLPPDQNQYVAYTTRLQTGLKGSFTNAGADTGGVFTTLDSGRYKYTFNTKAPLTFDQTATHTVGIYAARNMTEFGIPNNFASTTFNFVPAGTNVTKVRDVVKSTGCNACHDQISAHGGRRRGVEMCVLCHTPQSTDPSTGNTVDFNVMIHKLHAGGDLPSVQAGGTYIVNGTDFSTVGFPADIRRCESCHDLKSGAAQATSYLTKPTAATCGSCHDNVNFATGENHAGGLQLDDKQCANCHIPQGEIDFDASIRGGHVIPTESSLLTGIQVGIATVANSSAGQKPVVTFSIKDTKGNPLTLKQLAALSFTMAGPTTDYGYTGFGSDVTTPGYVTESALTAGACGADGTCTYSFKHAVPAGAKGTYAIGVESRRSETLLPGTTSEQNVAYGAKNQVTYFSVDGSAVATRRKVVDTANCNACHVALSVHGTLRNQTEYCVLCHNPSQSDSARRPAAVVAADKAIPPQGVNFNLLVHRIHTGENLAALGSSYTVVGFGGTHNDFSEVRYPAMSPTGNAGDTRNCAVCHVGGSEQILPLDKNAVVDPQGPTNPNTAIASSCSGCHANRPSAAHFLSNSGPLGESCTVCHAGTAQFSIPKVHAQY